MRALVLGGSGFIGSHLVQALLTEGHHVRVYARGDRGRDRDTRIEHRYGSISDDASVAEALQGVDVVFHLISTTLPSTSNLDPVADIEGNLIPTANLLDQMRHASVSRIVFLSSGGTVYGNPSRSPVPETEIPSPICSYGVVKVAIEHYLMMYRELYAIEPLIVRPSNPIGTHQGHDGVQGLVMTGLRRVMEHRPIEIWGDGTAVRDYIDVTDLASLCVVAAASGVVGTFNAGSGIGTSTNDVLGLIASVTGRTPIINYQPARPFDVHTVILDTTLALRTFGWAPLVPLHESIARVWRWLLDGES